MAFADGLLAQGRRYLKKEGRHRHGVTLTNCLPRAYVQFFKPGKWLSCTHHISHCLSWQPRRQLWQLRNLGKSILYPDMSEGVLPRHGAESSDVAHTPPNTVLTPSCYSLKRRFGSLEAPRRLSLKGRHRQLTEDLFVTLSPRCEVPICSPLNTAQRILLHSQLVALSVWPVAASIVATTYFAGLSGCLTDAGIA